MREIKGRVIRAGGWALSGFVISQVIRLGGNLILTRLLFPEAFGLMAIVYVLMAGLALFSDFGINQSIIQNRRGDESDFLNTAWVLQIFRGILVWLTVLLVAECLPLAVASGWISTGTVYADSQLPLILTVISFVALIQGFESTKIALAQRNIQLKQITKIEVLSQVVALVVMVVWALFSHSIWALVSGAIVAATVRCLMSHFYLVGPGNRFEWNTECFRGIFHFGKWIFILSVIGYFANSGDRILFGGLITPIQMGVYSIAFLLISALSGLFTSMISKVVFPAFTEVIREKPDRLSDAYYRFQLIADLFLFSAAGFLMFTGDAIVAVLYDDRYQEAGFMLSILSISLIAIRYTVVYQCCLAMGLMNYMFSTTLCVMIALYVSLPLCYELFGMEGALKAIVLSQFAGWPVAIYFKWKNELTHWVREMVGIPAFIAAAFTGYWVSSLIGN